LEKFGKFIAYKEINWNLNLAVKTVSNRELKFKLGVNIVSNRRVKNSHGVQYKSQTFIWLGSETAKRRFMNVFIASTTSSPALLVKSCKMLKPCK
jgi:hypothetical protein